jgi:hypothetical protein
MITIGEHRAPPPRPGLALADRRVEVFRGRDLKPLHPRRQRALVIGLDEQVHVRALDAEVHDPEVLAPSGRERSFADRSVRESAAQISDRTDDPQDNMHRIPGRKLGPRLVRRARPTALGFAASAAPLTTARLEQHQLLGLYAPRAPAGSGCVTDLHVRWIATDRRSVN